MLEAIRKLRQGIGELDREGRERLLASFSEVDRHFRELFQRLFGGGRAHLTLTESDDPLEAGLEIMASPPGKRLQALSLLSGGEQALTALALLFAVFQTNPAPDLRAGRGRRAPGRRQRGPVLLAGGADGGGPEPVS